MRLLFLWPSLALASLSQVCNMPEHWQVSTGVHALCAEYDGTQPVLQTKKPAWHDQDEPPVIVREVPQGVDTKNSNQAHQDSLYSDLPWDEERRRLAVYIRYKGVKSVIWKRGKGYVNKITYEPYEEEVEDEDEEDVIEEEPGEELPEPAPAPAPGPPPPNVDPDPVQDDPEQEEEEEEEEGDSDEPMSGEQDDDSAEGEEEKEDDPVAVPAVLPAPDPDPQEEAEQTDPPAPAPAPAPESAEEDGAEEEEAADEDAGEGDPDKESDDTKNPKARPKEEEQKKSMHMTSDVGVATVIYPGKPGLTAEEEVKFLAAVEVGTRSYSSFRRLYKKKVPVPSSYVAPSVCKHTSCVYGQYTDSQGRQLHRTFIQTSMFPYENFHCEKNADSDDCTCMCHKTYECTLAHHRPDRAVETISHCFRKW